MRCKVLPWCPVVALSAVLAGCGGGGDGDSSGESDDGGSSGGSAERLGTATEVVAAIGPPTMFSIECSRVALDASTGDWEPQAGFVRLEAWIYATSSGAEVFSLVNGEVIDRTQTDEDYTAYPNPDIDPRRYGCGEPLATVERVLGGERLLTTEGSDREAPLQLGSVQLKASYYTIHDARTGVQVLYANDQLVAMVTL